MSARIEESLPAQLERMRRSREIARPLRDTHVTLSHGSGGKAMHALIEGLLAPALANPLLDTAADAATIALDGVRGPHVVFTTDSYVVSPLFFPGGDIGQLAVHGTINDLAVAGARPLCLSVGLILEEGLEMDILRRVVESMADAATRARVPIVTGDTKVVPRGKTDRIFVNTSGVGVLEGPRMSARAVLPGDRVLLSGYVGDHGMAVMLAREALEIEAEIVSDSAPLHELVTALRVASPRARVMKDPTRGGLATSLNEIASAAGLCITIDEQAVPIRPAVRGACEILGIDPLHIANEGKLIAIVPPEETGAALEAARTHPLGTDAAIIGEVTSEPPGMVVLRTAIGGSRVLDMLVGDPLPRIC